MLSSPLDYVEVDLGDGETVTLSKLHRHVLYAIDEGRSVSEKYTVNEIASAFAFLWEAGLLGVGLDQLTSKGQETVIALRERKRAADVISVKRKESDSEGGA